MAYLMSFCLCAFDSCIIIGKLLLNSVEFTLKCYSFHIALDLFSEVDVRNKVFSAFNHTVHSR